LWKNISGINLYSTNKKVTTMNMGSMTFLVNTFDCIVMTDTLAYADDYKKSLSEVARVLKPRGRASFGIIYVLGETD
jgi:ubiquinone/menaquinone biosynthesis C-methylase UbiE